MQYATHTQLCHYQLINHSLALFIAIMMTRESDNTGCYILQGGLKIPVVRAEA